MLKMLSLAMFNLQRWSYSLWSMRIRLLFSSKFMLWM